MIQTTKLSTGAETPSAERRWAMPFFALWSSQAFSLLGSQLVSCTLIWHLTQTTGSAEVLAAAALLALLPQIVLGPFAGILIDRWSRKGILISVQVLMVVTIAVLAMLFSLGNVSLPPIYLLIFLLGVSSGFNNPAMIVATSVMVPDRHLTRIQGMNQTLQGGLNIISAPLGALLLSLFPMQSIFAAAVFPPLLAVASLLLIGIPPAVPSTQTIGTVFRDLRAGLRYIFAWPGLLRITGIAVILNFLDSPAVALTPLLVTKHFQGDAFQLGWMNSAFGVGVILGGVILSAWGGFQRRLVTSMAGIIGMGLGALVIGLTPFSAFWLAVAGIFIKGIMQTIANAPIIAALQSTIDPALQGRVMGLVLSLTSAAAPLGLLIAGPFSERFGVPIWFIILGGSCLFFGAAGLLSPSIKNLDARPGASC